MSAKVPQDRSTTNIISDVSKFWHSVKLIAAPYWYPTESGGRTFADVIQAWAMLILLIGAILGVVGLNAFNSFVSNYLVDVILEKMILINLSKLW